MKLSPRLALAALAGALTLTGLAATPAAARTSVSIEYRDHDYRGWRDYRPDRRDRNWRDYRNHDRWDRRDRRHEQRWRGNGRNCWTELRYDRRYNERYRVRVCR
jgi:hypothetical protein